MGVILSAGLLTGCAVGPDFQRPPAPTVTGYSSEALPAQTTEAPGHLGNAQQIGLVDQISPDWWRVLASDKLDALIDQALHASPTLAAAQATLRQAEENYTAQAGSTLYPQIDVNLSGQRQRFNPTSTGQTGETRTFNLYGASLGARYNFDFSGGNRRALESLAARTDYQHFQLQATRLTLIANLATTSIRQAQLASQVEATAAIIKAQEAQLEIVRLQLELGHASQDEVWVLQTQVEQTRASLPPLRNQFEQTRHLLALLAGQPPGTGDLPSFTLHDFTLPESLPLIVPSELVRQRPDIQAAEALLHAANADYGVSTANLYPRISLSANLGTQALSSGSLFDSGSLAWGLIGQLTQPLIDPGLPAKKRAALAAFDAAAANYRQTVLEALRQVADALRAIDNDALALAAQTRAKASSQAAANSMQHRQTLGAASHLQVLIAQQQSRQIQLSVIAAQAQRLIDTVVLYQAISSGASPGNPSLIAQSPLRQRSERVDFNPDNDENSSTQHPVFNPI